MFHDVCTLNARRRLAIFFHYFFFIIIIIVHSFSVGQRINATRMTIWNLYLEMEYQISVVVVVMLTHVNVW